MDPESVLKAVLLKDKTTYLTLLATRRAMLNAIVPDTLPDKESLEQRRAMKKEARRILDDEELGHPKYLGKSTYFLSAFAGIDCTTIPANIESRLQEEIKSTVYELTDRAFASELDSFWTAIAIVSAANRIEAVVAALTKEDFPARGIIVLREGGQGDTIDKAKRLVQSRSNEVGRSAAMVARKLMEDEEDGEGRPALLEFVQSCKFLYRLRTKIE